MSNQLEKLRMGRKSGVVLLLKAIKILSAKPDKAIFTFEGVDDVGVYEEWIKATSAKDTYEPLPGQGKEQLLDLVTHIKNHPQRDNIFLFVDRDFDESVAEKNLYELPAYSIENIICSKNAVESILKDEFRKAGDIELIESLKSSFAIAASNFIQESERISLTLFLARRLKIKITKKPEKASDFFSLTIKNGEFTQNMDICAETVITEHALDPNGHKDLIEQYSALPIEQKIKGKYVYEFLKTWLRHLDADCRTDHPQILAYEGPKPPGEPWNVSLRRLASATPPPACLVTFLEDIVGIRRGSAIADQAA